jgi:hypothetical protein
MRLRRPQRILSSENRPYIVSALEYIGRYISAHTYVTIPFHVTIYFSHMGLKKGEKHFLYTLTHAR